MHQQLHDKRIVCKDLIKALEACHLDTWSRWTGGCNTMKIELNKCLHAQSVKQAAANREKAKVRRERTEKAWQDIRGDSTDAGDAL
ncbi:COX assembly mitochondrial protein [Phanerochaete sordida]|uniref:COX assembly mitochondrial protein n=1 Tax=Phanerochaete sordida TaxID=48140 RepID=A0A9P3GKR5_9APHY|nr:COX assembly mitochondrial protein [Phanerochaete sordida]